MTWTHHPPPKSIDALLSEVLEFEASLLLEEEQQPDPSPAACSYLNHGGFGDPRPSVLKLRQYFTDLCYHRNSKNICTPMVYHRSLVPKLVARAKARACDYLSISSRKSFSFTSITSALFKVLDSVKFEEGDVIVTTDTIYHSLVDTISHFCITKKLKWVQVNTPVGCNPDRIFDEFKRVILQSVATSESSSNNQKQHRVKLAVLDHISSKPTILYPVDRMCELCQSLLIPTLVDGAHVPGSLPSHLIHIEDTKATFYVVTFHKWCNTPRGGASGGIWVNQNDIDDLYSSFIDVSSLVVDGGWHNQNNDHDMYVDASKPSYLTNGLTQGIYDESTREYENILVLPHCLDLVLKHEASFQQHAALLRAQSIVVLRNAWGLDEEEANMWGGCLGTGDVVALPMLAIPLPTSKLLQATTCPQGNDCKTVSLAKQLKRLKNHLVPKLWQEYAIEVPVFVWKNEIVGIRISFGRTVVIEDIERLSDAINRIIEGGISL
jgi:selenocysteine lyase/cysteine desulfurase